LRTLFDTFRTPETRVDARKAQLRLLFAYIVHMSRYDRASHRFYRDLRSDRWCGLVARNPSKRGRTLEKAGRGVVMGAQRIYFIKVMGFYQNRGL
jgi:hypothetical protein